MVMCNKYSILYEEIELSSSFYREIVYLIIFLIVFLFSEMKSLLELNKVGGA